MHPILDSLHGSQHEWLKKLLLTFNEGNIGKFEALAPLFPKEVCGCPALANEPANMLLAHPARELCVPPTKDLSHGSDRIRLQA